jgi:YegS/Rv2252/BmrU family lipid kinase
MPEVDRGTILFIINPISGGKTKTDWETSIRQFYGSNEDNSEFFILDGKCDEESIRHWVEKIRPKKVVAVGGDGTVSLVAKQLLDSGIPLGILPAGSANGMARELGLPLTATEALEVIAAGHSRDVDVIRLNDKYYCLHLSDVGLNALLIKHFEEGSIRGKIGYATKVIKTLWTRTKMDLDIKIAGKEVRMQVVMVVLANATKYGTGAVINPEGNMYDGKFEVVAVKKLAVSELFKMWFRPQRFDPAKIELYPATSVTITSKRNVHFQVDGEYLGKVKKVVAEILPGQLKLIVP